MIHKTGAAGTTHDTATTDAGTTDAATTGVSTSLRPRANRILRKIVVGYIAPLAVLVVAGALIPLFVWISLDQFRVSYEARISAAHEATTMQRAAGDLDAALRGLRSGDLSFRERVNDAAASYRDSQIDLRDNLEDRPDPVLQRSFDTADQEYRRWLRASLPRGIYAPPGPLVSFTTARVRLSDLTLLAQRRQDAAASLYSRAQMLRQIIVLVVPAAALLLALMIGRSIALGITRPLTELIRAAETLARGGASTDAATVSLMLDPHSDPDDEIGDLRQAFRHMGQTIGRREAVLRAQNDALGAIGQRIEAVLNATNDGIAMLDKTGAFSVVNERFAYLLGMQLDAMLDVPFGRLASQLLARFHDSDRVRNKLLEVLRDPEGVADEVFELTRPIPRTLRFFSAPVRRDWRHPDSDADELLGRIVVLRDVTRETQVDRMKTEFVSTVSHELRTPLTAIGGYVELMLGGQAGPLSPTQSEFLTLARANVDRLAMLIDDMLDISRIEAGGTPFRSEELQLAPIVDEAARTLAASADARQQALRVSVPPELMVVGDADRIMQTLVNLLSNAIKYTPIGGRITVTASAHDDSFATLCVADTGIGISVADQERIFDKFFRADNSTTRDAGGTGLGLAITRAIVERLGGSIWLETRPGQGTSFFFTLPRPRVDDAEAPPVPETVSKMRQLYLVVDGDVGSLHRLAHALRGQGVVVSGATSPAEAKRRARGLRPDAILFAPLSSGMGGLSTARSLCGDQESPPLVLAYVPRVSGGLAELRDTLTLVPPLDTPEGVAALAAALAGEEASDDGRRRSVVVLGGPAFIDAARRSGADDISDGEASAEPVIAAHPGDADRRLGPVRPHAVIIDAALDPDAVASFVRSLHERHGGARIPLILSGDYPEQVRPLVAPGTGALPVDRLAHAIAAHVGR